MTDNALFIPLAVTAVIALIGWIALAAVVLGQREIIRLAFDTFPKDAAVEMVDKFYKHAQTTANPYDDVAARAARGLVDRYDSIKEVVDTNASPVAEKTVTATDTAKPDVPGSFADVYTGKPPGNASGL